jgi:hypothetical protein
MSAGKSYYRYNLAGNIGTSSCSYVDEKKFVQISESHATTLFVNGILTAWRG